MHPPKFGHIVDFRLYFVQKGRSAGHLVNRHPALVCSRCNSSTPNMRSGKLRQKRKMGMVACLVHVIGFVGNCLAIVKEHAQPGSYASTQSVCERRPENVSPPTCPSTRFVIRECLKTNTGRPDIKAATRCLRIACASVLGRANNANRHVPGCSWMYFGAWHRLWRVLVGTRFEVLRNPPKCTRTRLVNDTND